MDNLHIDQHISKRFNEDLENLRTKLLELGGVVEQQILSAIRAMENLDAALGEEVLMVERDVDSREMQLDHTCTELLARHQPAASDLRLVICSFKITRDLERMGDEAAKIAGMAIELCKDSTTDTGYVEARHLAQNVVKLVRMVLDSFARYDVDTAVKVMHGDREIDEEYGAVMREMIARMSDDPSSIGRTMNLVWTLRSLERIGDHARNIAEHVIYLVRGKKRATYGS